MSGWPNTPRVPAVKCEDIDIDCDSSLICSAMLEYECVGPTDCWGNDEDRRVMQECLRSKCPVEAKVADDMIKTGSSQCPITGFTPSDQPRAPTLWHGQRLFSDSMECEGTDCKTACNGPNCARKPIAAAEVARAWPAPAFMASALLAAAVAVMAIMVVAVARTRKVGRSGELRAFADDAESELVDNIE